MLLGSYLCGYRAEGDVRFPTKSDSDWGEGRPGHHKYGERGVERDRDGEREIERNREGDKGGDRER